MPISAVCGCDCVTVTGNVTVDATRHTTWLVPSRSMVRTQISAKKVVGERAQVVRLGDDVLEPLPTSDPLQAPDPTSDPPRSPDPTSDGAPDENPSEVVEDVSRDPVRSNHSLYIEMVLIVEQWCSGCSNGGRLINCSFCLTRSTCEDCIPFPDQAVLQELDFMCPICHMERNPKDPYFVSRSVCCLGRVN